MPGIIHPEGDPNDTFEGCPQDDTPPPAMRRVKAKRIPIVDVPVESTSSLLSPGGRAAARIALALAKRVETQSR